jgi:hypothetical protein
MEPSNLPGKAFFVQSVTAVKHREYRPIFAARLLLGGSEVGVPFGIGFAAGRDKRRPRCQNHPT